MHSQYDARRGHRSRPSARCLRRRQPGVSSGSSEPEIKACSARVAVAYRYAGAMRSDNLHNDRQAQPGSAGATPLATPEPLKDVRSILRRDARAAILDTDRPFRADLDGHFGSLSRVRERILNEI